MTDLNCTVLDAEKANFQKALLLINKGKEVRLSTKEELFLSIYLGETQASMVDAEGVLANIDAFFMPSMDEALRKSHNIFEQHFMDLISDGYMSDLDMEFMLSRLDAIRESFVALKLSHYFKDIHFTRLTRPS